MKTVEQLEQWREGAERLYDDPAEPVGLVFVRYVPTLVGYDGAELVCTGASSDRLVIQLGIRTSIYLPVSTGGMDRDGERLLAFGLEQVGPGLWYLTPSMNLPKTLHAFVVLYDVPDPAPWER